MLRAREKELPPTSPAPKRPRTSDRIENSKHNYLRSALFLTNNSDGLCSISFPNKFSVIVQSAVFAKWSQQPRAIPVNILKALADEWHNIEKNP